MLGGVARASKVWQSLRGWKKKVFAVALCGSEEEEGGRRKTSRWTCVARD